MPLFLVQLIVVLLGLLGRVWPKALRFRSMAHFLMIVSRYDSVGERYGSRRLADYMQELAVEKGANRHAPQKAMGAGTKVEDLGMESRKQR